MRRINLLSGIFWCLILLLSCNTENSKSPKVHFVNPEVNSLYDFTTDLVIEIDITDDELIMEYNFWLESDSGWEYFSEKKKVNQDHYKILYRFDLSHNAKSDFSIHLEVVDNDGNKTHEKVNVSAL